MEQLYAWFRAEKRLRGPENFSGTEEERKVFVDRLREGRTDAVVGPLQVVIGQVDPDDRHLLGAFVKAR